MNLLVDPSWLAEHLDEVVVVDVRWSIGGGTAEATRSFEAGHIPGAVFLDVDRDLAGDPATGPGRHPLPSPDTFARTLGAVGMGADVPIVAYDNAGGSLAARLWWMLDAISRRVALLDGGLGAWPGSIETGLGVPRAPVAVKPRPWPGDRLVDAGGVAAALLAGTPVMDARAPERYRGEVEPLDPVAGHVPGARSVPWAGNLGADGRFQTRDDLRDRYRALGVETGAEAIAQCGSGITACHDLFAMRLAGLADARLYVGSWSDWVRDPTHAVAAGPEPGP
ncbi:MAG: sulfurtransferase [Actinomycetota bacterium]